MCGRQRHLCQYAGARQWDIYSMFFMLCNVTLWLQLKILEKGWNELLWIKVGEACNVKVIWTHAGETFLCDIFDIWQQRGSCKANRSSFSQILPVDSCIFDDQLDTRDCQGRSGPFVTIRQMGPSLALQICAMFSCYPILQLDEPLYILRAYSIWYNWYMCMNIEQSLNIPFLQFKSFARSMMSVADWALIPMLTSIILTMVGFQKIRFLIFLLQVLLRSRQSEFLAAVCGRWLCESQRMGFCIYKSQMLKRPVMMAMGFRRWQTKYQFI